MDSERLDSLALMKLLANARTERDEAIEAREACAVEILKLREQRNLYKSTTYAAITAIDDFLTGIGSFSTKLEQIGKLLG
jgi:hypothetical protein